MQLLHWFQWVDEWGQKLLLPNQFRDTADELHPPSSPDVLMTETKVASPHPSSQEGGARPEWLGGDPDWL